MIVCICYNETRQNKEEIDEQIKVLGIFLENAMRVLSLHAKKVIEQDSERRDKPIEIERHESHLCLRRPVPINSEQMAIL